MNPRHPRSGLAAVFGRRTGSGARKRHRAADRRRFSAGGERLEPRQLLAIFYRGVEQSNTGTSDESFNYIVDVDSTGTGEIWIRYEALQDRIDIADNPGFGNVSNLVRVPLPGFFGPAKITQNVPAPFSLEGIRTVPKVQWNDVGVDENFSSGALTIRADAGTRVFVANGDPLPLALLVVEEDPIQNPGVGATSVTIMGPVDARLNSYTTSPVVYNNVLAAETITVQAAMSTPNGNATQFFGDSLISIQSVVTSPLTNAYVGNGDFHLVAGQLIDGNLGVYVGQAGASFGFGAQGGDILIDGEVNGSSVTLNTNSSTQPVTIQTGSSGLLSGSGSLTLFNSGLDGGEINIRSAGYATTNVSTGAPTSPVRDIGIAIDQTVGNLRIQAVPTSRGQISLKSSAVGSKITIDSNVDTEAGLTLEADDLAVNRPLRTTAGNIVLTGNKVTVGSNVTAGSNGVGNVVIKSRTGGVTITSAAVVAAIDETITIEAKTDIDSLARLEANFLDLKAGGGIALKSNARELRATAGAGIAVTDDDSLRVRSAVAGKGDLAISALGLLEVDTATVSGAGAMKLEAGGGLVVGVTRTTAGNVSLAAQAGDVRVTDTVTVGGAGSGLAVTSAKGDIVIEATAAVTVPGEIKLSAPVGRVLTPGSVTKVIVDNPGQGYTQPPQVVFPGASPAAASAVVARSDQVAGITLAAGGSGYVGPVTVTIAPPAGGGTPATATATVANGMVTGVTITNQGSGYSSSNPPAITFSGAGSSGSGATAVAIIGSKVSGLQVVAGGSGYVTAPTVTLVGGGGSGAMARAFITNGVVTSLQVTNPGTGYTSAPTVVFSGGSGSGARAQAQIGGLLSIAVSNPGSGYLVPPRVVISAGDGASTGAITVNQTGGITGINLSSGGADYGVPPLVEIIDSTGVGTGAVAEAQLSNGAVTAITVKSAGQDYDPATTTVRLTPVSGGGGAVSGAVTVDANGRILGINVATGGQDYVTPPTVTITDTSGSGRQAVATAVLTNGQVTSFTINNAGFGYDPRTTIVTLTSAGNGATAVANLDANGSVASITVTNSGSGYQDGAGAPVVRLVEYGAGAQATATVSAGGVTTVTVPPGGGGSNYAVAPKVVFVGGGGTGATARAVIGEIAAISGGSLSWTAVNGPLDALLDEFSKVSINLTAPGNLVLTRGQGSLTVLGASTKDGRISITAPSLTIAGDIKAGNFSGSPGLAITLAATAGDLLIDANVGELVPGALVPTPIAKTVTLQAVNGKISSTNLSAAGLVTSSALVVDALAGAAVRTNVSSIHGGVRSNAANVSVTQTFVNPDGNVLPLTLGTAAGPLSSNNGTITVDAGSRVFVDDVDAQAGGVIVINATAIEESPVDVNKVDVRAAAVTLTAKSGNIALDTNVTSLNASAPLASITIRNFSGAQLAATLAGRNGVTLTSDGKIHADSVTSGNGDVSLTATGTASDITVGKIEATGFSVILSAGGAITPVNAKTASITAASADLTAATGGLDVVLTTPTVRAVAPGAIQLVNTGPMQIVRAESTSGQPITLAAGGTLSQSGPIVTTGLLTVTGNGLDDVVLRSPANDVGSLTASNPNKGLAFHSQSPLTVAAGGVVGGTVELHAGGPLTQAGPVIASVSLEAAATRAGAVQLGGTSNSFPSITGWTKNGNFVVVGQGGFSVGSGGIEAGRSSTIGGNGDIVLTALSGDITLVGSLTAVADTVDLRAAAGTVIQAQSSQITAGTLRVTSASQPQLQNGNTIGTTIIDVNGDITVGTPGQPTTVPNVFTTSGNITILGTDVTIANSVETGGLGKLISVAASGFIHFVNAGQIVNRSGSVALNAGGDIDAVNRSTVSASVIASHGLTVTAGGKTVLGTDVGALDAKVTGGVLDVAAVGALAITGINAPSAGVTLSAVGAISQTGPISAVSLAASSGPGGVTLQSSNLVARVAGTTSSGDFLFTAAGSFTVDLAGIRVGSAGAGDGGIELVTTVGNLTLAGDLTAEGDTVALRAPNGTITQTGGKITAEMLIWQAQAASFLPVNDFQGIGISLTSQGSVRVPSSGTAAGLLRIVEVTTVDGDIELVGEDVRISGLVQAGGFARSVTIRGEQGGIEFVGNGRVGTAADGRVALAAATAITATTAVGITNVTSGSLAATASAGAIDVSTAVGTLTAAAGAGITVRNSGAVALGPAGISGGSISLIADGNVTQAGPITADALTVVASAGAVQLAHSGNEVRAVSITNSGRPVTYRDRDGVEIGVDGLRGSEVSITTGGDLAQVGPIMANSLRVAATSGFVVLGNPANEATVVTIANAGRRVAYRSAVPFSVGAEGIQGNKVTLRTRGHLTQTGPVVANSLEVVASSGGVLLGHDGNLVESVTIANPSRLVGFRNSSAVTIGSAGIQGNRVMLRADGDLTQIGAITAGSLEVSMNAGRVALDAVANSVSTVAIGNPGRPVAFRAAGPVTIGAAGVQASSLALVAGGDVSQIGGITTGAFSLTAPQATAINLRAEGNGFTSFDANVGSAVVSLTNAGPLTINAAGTLNIGTVVVSNNLRVNTPGNLVVGPQSNALLQSSTQLDLRGVAGDVILVNAGRLVGPQILVNQGRPIVVGGRVADPASLAAAVDQVNSLPPIVGAVYEIVVASSMTVTRPLAFSRPVLLRGSDPGVTLFGSAAVPNGLVLDAAASGSRILNLAFAGFGGTAVRLSNAKNVTIRGITAQTSGNGLWISGDGAGTTVQGSRFVSNDFAIRLGENQTVGATNVIIGGNAVEQRNTIEGARQAGVIATGFCSRTQLIGTTFTTVPATPVRFNVRSSRGLTISNTIVLPAR